LRNQKFYADAHRAYTLALALGAGDLAASLMHAKVLVKQGASELVVTAVKGDPRELITGRMHDRRTEFAAAIEKTAIAAGTTTDSQWAGPLLAQGTLATARLQALANRSIIDAIAASGMQPAPVGRMVSVQSVVAVGNAPGEAQWKPINKLGWDRVSMLPQRVQCGVVYSDDLERMGGELASGAINDALDDALVRASNLACTEILLAGASPIASTGNARKDLAALLAAVPLGASSRPVLFVPQPVAAQLALMGSNNGAPAFPDMSITNGGMISNMPVVVVDALADYAGSPTLGNLAVLVDCKQILGDQGTLVLDLARSTSLQMVDDASGTGAAELVSLFQTNSLALRAERFYTLALGRSTAVAVVSNVNFADVGTP
jgi:HK97 family phage major capsid protein